MTRARRRFPAASIEANLTPMIDVSFLLIVFFVLVSRITDAEQAPMALPEVRAGSAARADDDARRPCALACLPPEKGLLPVQRRLVQCSTAHASHLLANRLFLASPTSP